MIIAADGKSCFLTGIIHDPAQHVLASESTRIQKMAFLFLAYPSENKLSRQKIHSFGKNTLGLRRSCPKVQEMAVKCVISSFSGA